MSFEEDQEAMADLLFREASEHDSTRSRPTDIAQLVQPFRPVTSWRCRYPQCRVEVDVDEEAVSRLATFNAELARRRELGQPNSEPIGTHQVMLCAAHQRLADDFIANRRREQHAELRDAIQKLKASNDPRNERALLDVLHKRHHPDIEGLLQALETKLAAKGGRRGVKL